MTPCWGMLGSNSVSWKMAFQESRWRCRWMKSARQKNAMIRSFCTTWGRAVWAPLRSVKGAWGVAEFPKVVILVFSVFSRFERVEPFGLHDARVRCPGRRGSRRRCSCLPKSLSQAPTHLPRTKIVLQKHFKAYLPTFGWMARWVIFYPQVRSLHWTNSPNSE